MLDNLYSQVVLIIMPLRLDSLKNTLVLTQSFMKGNLMEMQFKENGGFILVHKMVNLKFGCNDI